MNINELYAKLREKMKGGVLVLDSAAFGGAFRGLLNSFDTEKLEITRCSMELLGEKVSVTGFSSPSVYAKFGAGTLSGEFSVRKGRLAYSFRISVNGSGSLKEVFGGGLIGSDSFFVNFSLKNPVIYATSDKSGYRVTGTVGVSTDKTFGFCEGLFSEVMTMGGFAVRSAGYVDYMADFSPGFSGFSFPLGNAEVKLALRTLGRFSDKPRIAPFLMFKARNMTFQMEIPEKLSSGVYASAFFEPALTPKDIAGFLGELFGITNPAASLCLPDCAVLSDFGLKRLTLRLAPKGKKLTDGFELKYAEAAMGLREPWSTPISGLELTDFAVFSEMTLLNGKKLFSLSVTCEAKLSLGKYALRGRVSGYYPRQYYEGELALTDNGFTLADMAESFNCPVPKDWGKPLAEFGITASLSEHAYSLNACANGIIEVNAAGMKISVDSIIVNAEIRPSGNRFSFGGVFGFAAGGAEFQIGLKAQYDKYWSFSGELSGEISVAKLLDGLFGITASGSGADVILDGLSVSFAPEVGTFSVYASFRAVWFEVLGIRPDVGGRIKIESNSENAELNGSALFYLELGAFKFLVQADDFFTDKLKLLFRLSFDKLYIQGVYYKENGDETVRFSLGGMTFGELVLAFIRLINPNAKSELPAPWSVLNKIDLSSFSIVVNVTRKTAAVLYSANISVAGLMKINDIGIRYDFGSGDKLSFILTGKLLEKEYTLGDPLTWDVLDGAPPENTAPAETKTKIAYVGLGSHLKTNVNTSSVEEAVNTLKKQLKPASGVPDFQYSEGERWVFGADLTLGDLFRLQAALVDPNLYGAKITVNVTEKSPLAFFNGLELELVYRKISDSVGMFRCVLTVPRSMSRFELGVVSVTLGQISLEIYTNGSFYIDLGFPHNGDFSKSFGLEYGIFTGRGGIYFGTLMGDAARNVPEITNGAFSPVVLIGIGLRVGLGRSFDFGIVKGGVSLTATGILEGVFAHFNPKDKNAKSGVYYLVRATVGVSGTLFLSADLKIVSVSVSANVSAMCDLRLESYRRSTIKLRLNLKLSAKLKILFIKISFSFEFNQTVEFSVGSDSATPWTLAPQTPVPQTLVPQTLAEAVNADADALTAYNLAMFPLEKLGEWKISVSVLPLFSVKNPNAAALQYCTAFLCAVSEEDFAKLYGMLVEWLLASFPDDSVTRAMAASIPEKAEESLSLSDFESFFSKNLNVAVSPETESESELNGIFFPMLHCLKLICGETTVNFSQNIVTEQYFQMISEYLSRLNSDPLHNVEKAALNGGEMPMCAAVFIDYFRMILSELISKTRRAFDKISVETDSFVSLTERFKITAKEFLEQNSGVMLNVASVPRYVYTIQPDDTLKSLCERFSMSAETLWSDVSEVSMLPRLDSTMKLCLTFDNSVAGLTLREAAATFFVRLFDPDIIYFRYAEKIVSDNGLSPDWTSKTVGSGKLSVDGWSGEYVALAGDNAVRIAKAAALVNGGTADGWEEFLKDFSKRNTEGAKTYQVNGEYTIRDNTLAELNLRLRPDFDGTPRENFLWEQPILSPWKDAVLTDATLNLSSVTAADLGINTDVLADALEAGTAELSRKQTVSVSPRELSKVELKSLLLSDASGTGAMVSRFFLQGLRVPSFGSGEVTPLFELLGQQLDVEFTDEFAFSLEKSASGFDWVSVTKTSASLSGEALKSAIPDGILPDMPLPKRADDFSEIPKCWSASDVEIVLQDGSRSFLCVLPEDMRGYLARNSADSVKSDGGFDWAYLTEFPITKAGSGVYRFGSAAPRERERLYEALDKPIKQLRVLTRVSKLDTNSAEYAEILPARCMLIRSDVSTETHFESLRNSEQFRNIAALGDAERFLRLAWECSTIGGGYTLCCTDVPESAFDGDTARIYLLAVFESDTLRCGAVNCAVFDKAPNSVPVFVGTAEKAYVPNYPVGSVGVRAAETPRENGRTSELFNILGYTVKASNSTLLSHGTLPPNGTLLESMPILPQMDADGAEFYSAAVPLYRLCGKSPYDAVGKSFGLDFFRRDVLGNTVKLGAVTLDADYNDYLLTLGQLPCVKTSYLTEKKDGAVKIAVTSRFVYSDKDVERARETALTAALQAECDIELTFSSALGTMYTLSADELSRYREFTRAVCEALNVGGETGAEFSVLFAIDTNSLPKSVFELSLTAKLTRKNARCEFDGVKSAECVIPRGEGFEERFAEALPELVPAAGGSELYAIPRDVYFRETALSPFVLNVGENSLRTPRFYSTAPFSRGLITRSAEVTAFGGESVTAAFSDVDMELWTKRFLGDIENLLSGEAVSGAAESCPELADELIDIKKALSERFADRLSPLIDGFAGEDVSAARETAVQLFSRSLNNVYDVDTFCVYSSKLGHSGEPFRLEGAITPSDGLCAGKVDSERGYFCAYSFGGNVRSNDPRNMSLSFIHFEYDIQRDPSGYESSKWLRLLTPLTSEKIDLSAELGVPHPLKLFPECPKLLSHSCRADSAILRYSYTARISCKAFEQQTLYLRLRFGINVAAQGRDSVFDILADYDFKRTEILRHISARDGDFRKAYEYAVTAARNLAEAMSENSVQAFCGAEADEIILKLGFKISDTIEILAEPFDVRSREFVDKYGIEIKRPKILSCGGAGKDATFDVGISNLPVFVCPYIEPSAWIVQNENLFGGMVKVSEEFIFRTEEVLLEPLYIHAEYSRRLSADSVGQAAQKAWELLELSGKRVSAAVTCCFELDGTCGILTRLPAVFLPKSSDYGEVADAVKRWLENGAVRKAPSAVTFKLSVLGKNGDSPVSAEITAELSGNATA